MAAAKTSEDCIVVAEALSAQIAHLRESLPHRALFSAVYNRKMTRKIELLDDVRQEFLERSRDLLRPADDQIK